MSALVIRIVLLVLALAVATGIALALRRRDRRVVSVGRGQVLTAADLASADPASAGRELGSVATFVQFSSPVCSGCRATARVLDEITAQDDRVRRIEVDVTQRLDLARQLDIMRTPTTVVLDAHGQVISRLSGVPTREQALAAATLTSSSGQPGSRSDRQPSLNPVNRS